ncbi:DEAD/DEAH box helicase [Bdellovibrio sp. HCB209]|uniref:DEAD/DEAH box helicase n=1 Tax=Bdellovibrio sp. HCB209 TaxID=3394354 RepID=UPI0039B64FE7
MRENSEKSLKLLQSMYFNKIAFNIDPNTDEIDVQRVISLASFLSSMDGDREKQLSSDILSYLIELLGTNLEPFREEIIYVLTSLGRFPSILQFKNIFDSKNDPNFSVGMSLQILRKRMANRYVIGDKLTVHLTDYQNEIVNSLTENVGISLSAPTSAGKTFSLNLAVLQLLREGRTAGVIVVPTRALIREMVREIKNVTKDEDRNVLVLGVPAEVRMKENEAVVYVLTQERLNSLLGLPSAPALTFAIIDEANEISKSNRGILLENVISELIYKNPSLKLIFSTPLCANPEVYWDIFSIKNKVKDIPTEYSPVTHNTFLVESKKGTPSKVDVYSMGRDREVSPIGTRDLPGEFRNYGRVTSAVKAFSKIEDGSVIYASWPDEAFKIARKLNDTLSLNLDDREVNDMVDFLSSEVHEEYDLIDLLKGGIGVHCRQMPDFAKEFVEDLFRRKKIGYIVCTSTLLQGVNLPCKNIFLLKPKSGKFRDMSAHDFWNLSGRAGRMSNHFMGNIWCLDTLSWRNTPHLNDKKVTVKDAFKIALETDSSELVEFLSNPESNPNERSSIPQAANRIVIDYYFSNQSIHTDKYKTVSNETNLVQIDKMRESVLNKIRLPPDIIHRNSGVSVWALNRIFDYLNTQQDLTKFIPRAPFQPDFYENLVNIFQVCFQVVRRQTNFSYKYHAGLANRWMKGEAFKHLLSKDKADQSRASINQQIQKLIEVLDDEIRYKYVLHIKAFTDVFEFVANKKGKPELLEEIAPLHVYLEIGASDPVMVSLMSLGLSRSSAARLKDNPALRQAKSMDAIIDEVKRIKPFDLELPNYLKVEIANFINRL